MPRYAGLIRTGSRGETSVADETRELDIVERVIEALSRTSEPRPTASGSMKKIGRVIGSVPLHLRYFHNLIDELKDECVGTEKAFRRELERCEAIRKIFFDALLTQVPAPEGAIGVAILPNWDVVDNFHTDGADEPGGNVVKSPLLFGKLNGKHHFTFDRTVVRDTIHHMHGRHIHARGRPHVIDHK